MMGEALLQAVVSGVIGGVFTGVAAWAAIKVEVRWLRRDVDFLLNKWDEFVKGN